MSITLNIQDKDFEETVVKSDLPVVVDFWAPWCGPCKVVGPVIDSLASELEGRVRFVKINVDDNVKTAGSFGVRGIPTLLFFRDGELAKTVVGAQSEDSLRALLGELFDIRAAS